MKKLILIVAILLFSSQSFAQRAYDSQNFEGVPSVPKSMQKKIVNKNVNFNKPNPQQNNIQNNVQPAQQPEIVRPAPENTPQQPDTQPQQQVQQQMPVSAVAINEQDLPWLQKKEPAISEKNLIRIKFDEAQENLKPENKTELKALVSKLSKDLTAKLTLKSYAKPRGENSIKARQAALRRTLEIRKFFETNGIDFKRVSVQIMGDQDNSLGLDYIDIDRV